MCYGTLRCDNWDDAPIGMNIVVCCSTDHLSHRPGEEVKNGFGGLAVQGGVRGICARCRTASAVSYLISVPSPNSSSKLPTLRSTLEGSKCFRSLAARALSGRLRVRGLRSPRRSTNRERRARLRLRVPPRHQLGADLANRAELSLAHSQCRVRQS
jgi:hypothetical protein